LATAWPRETRIEGGSFEGEIVWCPIILAQHVILCSFLRRPISEPERAGMVRHFMQRRQPDGGLVVGNSVANGMRIKMVAGIFRRNSTAVGLDESAIKTPKDLEGKTDGSPTRNAVRAVVGLCEGNAASI
jgi:hypothetical protein